MNGWKLEQVKSVVDGVKCRGERLERWQSPFSPLFIGLATTGRRLACTLGLGLATKMYVEGLGDVGN